MSAPVYASASPDTAPAPPSPSTRAAVTNAVGHALRLAGVLTAAALLVALWVGLFAAAQARDLLGYTFPGVPARPDTAVLIFKHNCGELLGILAVLLFRQLAARDPAATRSQRLVGAIGEAILAFVVLVNVVVVGAGIGAYGTRMLVALLPHGPVELAAYANALALYSRGRDRPLGAAELARAIGMSVALLALAAVLETWVNV
jgi:hypothetical protein